VGDGETVGDGRPWGRETVGDEGDRGGQSISYDPVGTTREGQSIRDTPKKLQTAGLDC